MTAEVLAVNIQRTRNTIVNWEKGKSLPDINEVCALAHTFNVSPMALLALPNRGGRRRESSSAVA